MNVFKLQNTFQYIILRPYTNIRKQYWKVTFDLLKTSFSPNYKKTYIENILYYIHLHLQLNVYIYI